MQNSLTLFKIKVCFEECILWNPSNFGPDFVLIPSNGTSQDSILVVCHKSGCQSIRDEI